MPRFYCPDPLSIGAELRLSQEIAHHLHVRRLGPGDRITLFNGSGGEFLAVLSALDKKLAVAEIKTFSPREAELPYSVTLAQALPEASKMDWIIEKSVELGATLVQPIAAQRCVVRLNAERAAKRVAHWQAIVASASEQCGRNRLAHVAEPMEMQRWLDQQDLHVRILLTPRAEQPLSAWAKHHPPQAVSLLIGPEGGFSEDEEKLALDHGVLPFSMGPRVLRTETAGLAALTALNAIWGEM